MRNFIAAWSSLVFFGEIRKRGGGGGVGRDIIAIF